MLAGGWELLEEGRWLAPGAGGVVAGVWPEPKAKGNGLLAAADTA